MFHYKVNFFFNLNSYNLLVVTTQDDVLEKFYNNIKV